MKIDCTKYFLKLEKKNTGKYLEIMENQFIYKSSFKQEKIEKESNEQLIAMHSNNSN
jgi:hypothetical protein